MIKISEKEFVQLSSYIRENYGVNLKKEKKMLVIGRLQNVLLEHNFESFSEYYQYIISDKSGKATSTLINKITTNHTYFMREESHFQYLRDKVLPYLADVVKDRDLRIWSAGCSSGEESYTIAMIVDEFFKGSNLWWDKKILATDICEEVLNTAVTGIYNRDRISPLPEEWKKNYLKLHDSESYIFNEKIKNEIIYRKFNLMDNKFPFKKKFHAIFCRNVMIYFDNNTKNELIHKFYNSLEFGGYLFIGHSESLAGENTGFKYIMPSVYRKE